MTITKEEIAQLEKVLGNVLPQGEDGLYGTDGSHEELMDAFERAWDKTDDIAWRAIKALKEIVGI